MLNISFLNVRIIQNDWIWVEFNDFLTTLNAEKTKACDKSESDCNEIAFHFESFLFSQNCQLNLIEVEIQLWTDVFIVLCLTFYIIQYWFVYLTLLRDAENYEKRNFEEDKRLEDRSSSLKNVSMLFRFLKPLIISITN